MMIPMMKVIDLADAAAVLTDFAKDTNHEPIIVAVQGRPVAVVLSAQGGDLESISVSLNPEFNALMERSGRRLDREGGISHDEMRRRLGLPRDGSPKRKTGGRKVRTKKRKPNGREDGRQV